MGMQNLTTTDSAFALCMEAAKRSMSFVLYESRIVMVAVLYWLWQTGHPLHDFIKPEQPDVVVTAITDCGVPFHSRKAVATLKSDVRMQENITVHLSTAERLWPH